MLAHCRRKLCYILEEEMCYKSDSSCNSWAEKCDDSETNILTAASHTRKKILVI